MSTRQSGGLPDEEHRAVRCASFHHQEKNVKDPIPQNVIEAAKADFGCPLVQDYIAEACIAAGGDPKTSPAMYPPAADDVYTTLRTAHHFASIGEPDRDPYPVPEGGVLWLLVTDAQRAEVKALPTWQQCEAVRAFARG
jgi:hypothetical protein